MKLGKFVLCFGICAYAAISAIVCFVIVLGIMGAIG